MGDQLKNKALISTVVACWGFMLWWWLISGGGILGLIMAILVGAVAGGVAWLVTGLLT